MNHTGFIGLMDQLTKIVKSRGYLNSKEFARTLGKIDEIRLIQLINLRNSCVNK
jgi:hypothetical protein